MIRRHLMALRLALMVADGVTATLVFALVSIARFGDGDLADLWARLGIDIRVAAPLFGLGWVAALRYLGMYRLRARWRLLSEAQDIAKATLIVLALTLSTLFIFKQENVSRLFLVLLFIIQPLVTFAGRTFLRLGFAAMRRRGYNSRFMLIAGTGALAQEFADRVEAHPGLGIQVIGHLSVPGETDDAVSRPVLGTLADIQAVFHSRVVDEVGVCLPPTAAQHVEPISRLAAVEGKTVRIPVDPGDDRLPRVRQEEFDGFLVRSLVRDDHEKGLVAKRLIDITGAAVGLVLISPITDQLERR